jgi:IS5 family transposase
VATGTIVDATIINAPSSTKNTDKARDPEMHQTKKGNQWYFGMKAHLGVDSRTKLIHAVVATPANVADSTVLPELLHGQETRVWGDQAYRGQRAVIREHAPKARDSTNRRYRHRGFVDEVERAKNRTKSKVRARVEHAIGVIKRVFGFAKVRYRGLKKNTHRLLVTCALANLFMMRRRLLRCQGASCVRSLADKCADIPKRHQHAPITPHCGGEQPPGPSSLRQALVQTFLKRGKGAENRVHCFAVINICQSIAKRSVVVETVPQSKWRISCAATISAR